MVSKVVILFLAAFVAFEGINGNRIDTLELERGIGDIAQDAINKLKELVGAAIDAAVEQFSNISETIEAFAKTMIETTKEQMDKVSEQLSTEINELSNKAMALGVDISSCGIEKADVIKNMPNAVIDKATECVKTAVNRAKDIVDEATNGCNDMFNKVAQLGDDLSKCPGGLGFITCATKIAAAAASDAITFPIKIGEIASKAMASGVALQAELSECAAAVAATSVTEATNIAVEITSCIKQKIEEAANNPQ